MTTPALTLLVQARSGSDLREYMNKNLARLVHLLTKDVTIEQERKDHEIDGIRVDRYRASFDKRANRAVFLDVGQIDDVALISISMEAAIDASTQESVEAIRGQHRYAELPGFKEVSQRFAGNHLGFAMDLVTFLRLVKRKTEQLPSAKGLSELSIVARQHPGEGLALRISVDKDLPRSLAKLKL